jgi:hypothetical protein
VKSIGRYVWRSSTTIVRIFATYKPLTFFWLIALFFLAVGVVSGGWYLAYKLMGQGAGHIQSAVLAASAVTIGLILFMLGFLADLSAVNRRLLERIDWRLRQLENAQARRAAEERAPSAVPDAKADRAA